MLERTVISKGISYPQYREEIELLLSEGKVTGTKQSQALIDFTRLNIQRMNRLDKTTALLSKLAIKVATLSEKQIWILLAQGWCGDCAQIIPVIGKIADAGKQNIDLRIFNPDVNPELMDAYLTNGARSVPKLIIVDAIKLSEKSVWGPRPAPAQKIMLDWKNAVNKTSWEEFERELHTWYARDRSMTLQEEIFNTLFES